MKVSFKETVDVKNTLGEGITWDPRHKVVYWTDIEQSKLYRYSPGTKTYHAYSLPERLGSFGLTTDPDTLICAFETGFYLYNYRSSSRKTIWTFGSTVSGVRMNDGRLDASGRFWAGAMVEDEALAPVEKASLYSCDPLGVRKHFSGVNISNGLAWSVDGTRMYYSDSASRIIYRHEFLPETGRPLNREIFIQTPKGEAPDGAIVDLEDHLWVAHWGGGKVVRYNPDGAPVFELNLRVSQPTCVCFGGDDMQTLFISSASAGLSAEQLEHQPDAGNIFTFETGFKGFEQKVFYTL